MRYQGFTTLQSHCILQVQSSVENGSYIPGGFTSSQNNENVRNGDGTLVLCPH